MTQPSADHASGSDQPTTVSAYALRQASAAIAPYIEDNTIEWDHLQRVLDSVRASDALRGRLTAGLKHAGISVRGRPATPAPPTWPEVEAEPSPAHQDPGMTQAQWEEAAMSAARRLMDQDAHRVRLDNRILTAEEEVGLGLIIRNGSGELDEGSISSLTGERRRAADTMFLHNTRLAWSVAQHHVGHGLELEDLAQSAMIGLLRAVEKFDPLSGNKFSTYATWWLRQAVSRAIANQGRLIRVPVHMHDRIRKVWRMRDELYRDGVPPRVPELARACNLTPKQVVECLILRSDVVSLDQPVGDDGTSLGDILDLPVNTPNAFDILWEDARREQIHAVLDTLSDREATVILLRHGLDLDEPMTLDAIGEIYGLSRERIRQIEAKTLEKLRDPSSAEDLRPYL